MSGEKLEFGYLPKLLDCVYGSIKISTLHNLDTKKQRVEGDLNIRNEWIYPGNAETYCMGLGYRAEPFSCRVFSLPKTHLIERASPGDSIKHLRFHIWVLSFFMGMRLTADEAGFLDATPIKAGKLVDFVVHGNIENVIALAETFWLENRLNDRQTNRVCAAIHALFIAQYPQNLQFERFIHLYTALDACFALMWKPEKGKSRPSHSDRLTWMGEQLGVPVPEWAIADASSSNKVSALRNDAIHEAIFFGEPLGFAIEYPESNGNLTLEMEHFFCRILVAVLGIKDRAYIESACDHRDRHLLRV